MSTHDPITPPARGVRVGHLVAGLLFLGVALLWWLFQYDVLATSALPYAVPLVLIVAGAVALLAHVVSARRRFPATPGSEIPADPYPSEEDR